VMIRCAVTIADAAKTTSAIPGTSFTRGDY